MQEYHRPVLLEESIEGLNIDPDGVYVDLTFGGGGHSKAIVEKLKNGHLYAFDQDKDAKANAAKLENRSFTFVAANFRHLGRFLKLYRTGPVDGILADLGVSSYQFDQPNRGFSIRHQAKLDMRMDQQQHLTAAKVINEYEPVQLKRIFSEYGEIRNTNRLTDAIVSSRSNKPIATVDELKEIIEPLAPRHREFKYFAQVFQALRVEVNDELSAIREMLEQANDWLKPGGRLVCIAYHSLEDRLIKNFTQKGNLEGKEEKDFYGNLLRPMEPVNRKPIMPSQEEIEKNNRARSARLRIAKKI